MNNRISSQSGQTPSESWHLPRFFLVSVSAFLSFSLAGAQRLSLTDAWSRFLERSPLVAAEGEKLQMARGRLSQSQAWANPTLHYSQEGYPVGLPESGYDDQEFLISAWQEFELGGQREKRRDFAQLQLDAGRARYSDFLRLQRLEISRLFVEVFFASKQKEWVESAHEKYLRIRGVHQKRYEAGEASGLAQMKIEAEELWYLVQLSRVERGLNSTWAELAALIGWEMASLPELILENSRDVSPPDVALLVQKALDSRPDLEAKRFESLAAKRAVELEKARNTPNLNLGGGYKRDFGQNSFFLGVQLPLPLWDRRLGAIEEKLAESRRQATLESWQEIWIRHDVQRAYDVFVKLLEAARRLDAGFVQKLERTVEITALSYQEGEAGILEYLDAIRTQRDAQLERNRLDEELHLAQLELEASIGIALREITP